MNEASAVDTFLGKAFHCPSCNAAPDGAYVVQCGTRWWHKSCGTWLVARQSTTEEPTITFTKISEKPGISFFVSNRSLPHVMVHPPPEGSKVNHPPHYNTGSLEVIDAIEGLGLDKDFLLGNVVKYVARAKHKDHEAEDLTKARWYLDRAIGRANG